MARKIIKAFAVSGKPGPRGAIPDRVYDVGIAEQHAVTSAVGRAMAGLHPVVAIYSTFLNRAFDQTLMDVPLHKLPVTIVPDREETTQVIRRVTGELADLAGKAAVQAAAVLRNGCRAIPKAVSGRMRGRLRRSLDELAVTIERTGAIIAQTRTRLAGQTPDGATRLVSLHDPDARPIRKGRIDRPVEFGYKAQVSDNDDGIVLDYNVEYGAAPDGPQLAPAVQRVSRRAGRVPRAVTADRGYGHAAVESDLHELGVRTVAIPRQATTSAARRKLEHSRGFHKLVKWRTGSEGRISYLKRGYGWDRTRLDGRQGAAIWCGHGVFAHNLVKIGALAS